MDYRLLKIKEYSQTINNLREKTRILEIQNSSYQKIIDDLDQNVLKGMEILYQLLLFLMANK